MAKPRGRSPSLNRWKKAGSSFRFVRSPDAPKITTACGSAGLTVTSRSFRGEFRDQLLQVHILVPQERRGHRTPCSDEPGGAPNVLPAVQSHGRPHQFVLDVEGNEVSLIHAPPHHQV